MQIARSQNRRNAKAEAAQALPVHEIVYRALREMILFGELEPGQAVTIQGLVGRLGAGMTPVREALRRLTAEGALEFRGNRRICVPRLGPSELEQVRFVRCKVEPRLAELATPNLDKPALGALRQIDDELNHAIELGNVRAYLRHNYRFHHEIYRHAGADVLMQITGALWLRVGPSLRIIYGRHGTANLPDMHDEALSALSEGDGKAAARAILLDIEQGHEQIAQTMGASAHGGN